MSKLNKLQIKKTFEKLADACMAKRARLIDCNQCAFQANCDNMWKSKRKKKQPITDIEVAERHFA